MPGRWDDVVVGAGSAGCCVARRLADAGRRVLLLEAGSGYPPSSITGGDFLAALDEPGWTWPGLTTRRHPEAPMVAYTRGRGVGGSSAVNALVAMTGQRDDYERWERVHGCVGRGWRWIEPGFVRARERLRITHLRPGPLTAAVAAAATAAGHEVGGTSLDLDRLGMLACALTLDGGRRWSAAEAYLRDPPPGLAVTGGAVVGRVALERGRAVGVVLADGEVIEADRVVLSAGAVHSPALLVRSGVDLPGVGRSARDHPAVAFTVALPPGARVGPAAVSPITSVLRWSSGVAAGRADLQLQPLDHLGAGDGRSSGSVMVALMDVRSTGEVLDAQGGPDLHLSLLADEVDRARLVRGVRHAIALLAPVGAALGSTVVGPDGTTIDDLGQLGDDELARWIPTQLGDYAHLSGTCRMGPRGDDGRVVDLDGAVTATSGLYVIDASVFPDLPRSNPHLPTLAVAERLADGLVG